jgi:hypothetical protein
MLELNKLGIAGASPSPFKPSKAKRTMNVRSGPFEEFLSNEAEILMKELNLDGDESMRAGSIGD